MDRRDQFKVVINHEEQYSIWPADRALTERWREAGFAGTEDEAWQYLEREWRDITPRDRERIRADMRRG
jgi:MbtH protein